MKNSKPDRSVAIPAPGSIREAVGDDYEWIVPTPLDGRSVWGGREGVVEFIRTWTEQITILYGLDSHGCETSWPPGDSPL